MKVKLHKLLFYTLVLGVYGIFFSVECFYNFEGQGSSLDRIHSQTVEQHGAGSSTVIQNFPARSNAAYSLRLNKRYHQEEALPVALIIAVLPEYMLAPRMLGCYCRTDLPARAHLHRPLRGPPSLA